MPLTPTAPFAPAMDEPLLSPEFLTRLEQLEIVSRKIHAARQKGERKSRRKGESAEFADYRNYVSGDDLRHIDWNIYARLDRLFLKLFLEEEELHICTLLDVSGSMSVGQPSKALYAKRVAAAISYIGLCQYDRVSVYAYNDRLVGRLVGLRSRRMLPPLVRFLESLTSGGRSHLSAAAKQFAVHHTQKGVGVIVSDLLDKGGFEDGLKYLLGRHMDVHVVHVLSQEEMAPDLAGDLKLVDCEDDDIAEVTISRPLLDRYQARLQAYCEGIRDYCHQRGVSYSLTSTASPFETLILNYMRKRGLVR